MLAGYVAGGATQVRIVGELPAASFGPVWDTWARYESAINHAYDEFPLWSLCVYDTRTTSEPMLADIARTHPRRASNHARRPVPAIESHPSLRIDFCVNFIIGRVLLRT